MTTPLHVTNLARQLFPAGCRIVFNMFEEDGPNPQFPRVLHVEVGGTFAHGRWPDSRVATRRASVEFRPGDAPLGVGGNGMGGHISLVAVRTQAENACFRKLADAMSVELAKRGEESSPMAGPSVGGDATGGIGVELPGVSVGGDATGGMGR
jgi:hypothetical protein